MRVRNYCCLAALFRTREHQFCGPSKRHLHVIIIIIVIVCLLDKRK